ncbi:HAD hydrolase-like protein [Salinisphaera sp. T31B1]|uniref:HAD hydrolase-like protein n=1 Tax=Salinisphaera sp. T31B1 TaxID=727963 RepID=UPI003342C009
MRYKVLLFDLDGTLTDPREGITRCVQHALACQQIDEPDRSKLDCFIGPPLKQSFIDWYGMEGNAADRAVADYRERFGEIGMFENTLYAGIVELLTGLKRSGRQLFVATSKPWFYARQIITHFGLDEFFGRVYGSELDGTRVEKHALIAHILREERIEAGHALMIGDRRYDLIGARHNGVAAAAVGYGYGSRDELMAEQPDHYFATLAELDEALRACRV